MNQTKVTDSIVYIGVDDKTLDLFESQYKVPNGVSYNSYLILDQKTAVMDTSDARVSSQWFDHLESALGGRNLDYLVVSHMEPDHAANILTLTEKYPNLQVVGNTKTFGMISQFFDIDLANRSVVVKEGETLCLGNHTLQFFMAPMVHWPEVMVTYEQSEKILFTADGFGKFGTLDIEEEWEKEARRYYFNIVGKYGMQVQALLKKAAALDIKMICPLHGPVLKENLEYYIRKYDTWSRYEPEVDGILIAYASIHGNTARAVKKMAEIMKEHDIQNIALHDLTRQDSSEAVADAFRYQKLIVASATYDGGLFPCMEEFLLHLKAKAYQRRKVGIIENGSWAPMAGKHMRNILEGMKEIEVCETQVSIKSAMKEHNITQMEQLIKELCS